MPPSIPPITIMIAHIDMDQHHRHDQHQYHHPSVCLSPPLPTSRQPDPDPDQDPEPDAEADSTRSDPIKCRQTIPIPFPFPFLETRTRPQTIPLPLLPKSIESFHPSKKPESGIHEIWNSDLAIVVILQTQSLLLRKTRSVPAVFDIVIIKNLGIPIRNRERHTKKSAHTYLSKSLFSFKTSFNFFIGIWRMKKRFGWWGGRGDLIIARNLLSTGRRSLVCHPLLFKSIEFVVHHDFPGIHR